MAQGWKKRFRLLLLPPIPIPTSLLLTLLLLLLLSMQGCGLVEYASHTEAAAALTTLNSNFTWPGAHSPMSVEWCSTSKQQQQQQQQQQQ
jgi:hypothetical protein